MTTHKSFVWLLRSFACFICLSAALNSTFVLAQDIVHVVQPGENLFRIALSYGLTTDILARANGISDTSQIYAG